MPWLVICFQHVEASFSISQGLLPTMNTHERRGGFAAHLRNLDDARIVRGWVVGVRLLPPLAALDLLTTAIFAMIAG